MALNNLMSTLGSANSPKILHSLNDVASFFEINSFGSAPTKFDLNLLNSMSSKVLRDIPINFIKNIKKPSTGNNPKNIFFLTADAFGVLPPISKLNPSQSAYHFISGYTSKLAGTEDGVDEPVPSFSACFGAPFMPLHPTVYAKMLIKKMSESGVDVWLVNTGWTGGPYGIGKRMELKYTRAMINAAMYGELDKLNADNYHIHSVFNLMQPRICPNVPTSAVSYTHLTLPTKRIV